MPTKTTTDIPIVHRFPALAGVPRAGIGSFPTPVERHVVGGRALQVKRDDRSGTLVGGNKVRGLDWLLGGLRPGEHVLTVGPTGSNHALCTALYARHLGARATVVRWRQEMNPTARAIDPLIRNAADVIDARWVAAAYAVAAALRARRHVRWIPAGGATPVAMLGHVNAALELAGQIADGQCTPVERVYVPLGTGGTAAGLALGFRIAGIRTRVVAVRVVPRILGNAFRLIRLAHRVARVIERVTGERVPRLGRGDIGVEHAFYGGAYGRPLPATMSVEGVVTDDTYSAKTLAAAAASPHESLFWLTFDARVLRPDIPGIPAP